MNLFPFVLALGLGCIAIKSSAECHLKHKFAVACWDPRDAVEAYRAMGNDEARMRSESARMALAQSRCQVLEEGTGPADWFEIKQVGRGKVPTLDGFVPVTVANIKRQKTGLTLTLVDSYLSAPCDWDCSVTYTGEDQHGCQQ